MVNKMDETKTITETIVNNASELETMKVLQLKLARTLDESSSGRDIAALARQLQQVTQKIKELEALESKRDTVLDQVLTKYKGRQVRNESRQAVYQEG